MSSDVEDAPDNSAEKETTEAGENLENSEADFDVKVDENGGECTFSYERLKSKSTNPAKGIDYKRREAYLSNAEFESVLGMAKEAFYQQPKWKQDMQKRKVDLF